MALNNTYDDTTWMETLYYASRRPNLPTIFYSFQIGSLSHEKNGFKVKALFQSCVKKAGVLQMSAYFFKIHNFFHGIDVYETYYFLLLLLFYNSKIMVC